MGEAWERSYFTVTLNLNLFSNSFKGTTNSKSLSVRYHDNQSATLTLIQNFY